jgi:glycosyltransferase involved in cell wall biosynthesis
MPTGHRVTLAKQACLRNGEAHMVKITRDTIKFTVVIPTRERCDTLEGTIRTCVNQDYEDLEIIVSDNFSQDNTKDVVQSFDDRRLHYINTGKRLSMSDNWEFALSHVDGGYVLYLGDDDGLLPGALSELQMIIQETGCDAVSWKSAEYYWPSCAEASYRNLLLFPLKTGLEQRNTREVLEEVLAFRRNYLDLPLLYKGVVRHEAIKKAARESGRFFHSMIPDVYSAIALASVLQTYWYSYKPYALNGASPHSTGAAAFSAGEHGRPEREFLSEDNMPFHKMMAYAPSMAILVGESLLQAREYISAAKTFEIDLKRLVKVATENAKHLPTIQYERVTAAINEIGRINQISGYASRILRESSNSPIRPFFSLLISSILGRNLMVDCASYNVRDVYGASVLCDNLISMKTTSWMTYIAICKFIGNNIKRNLYKIC